VITMDSATNQKEAKMATTSSSFTVRGHFMRTRTNRRYVVV